MSLDDEGGMDLISDRQLGYRRDFQTLGALARHLYEVLDYSACSVPILERQKSSGTGQFNTKRLKELQQFVPGVGGAGLSRREQRLLYNFLSIWDAHGNLYTMKNDEDFSLRAAFPTVSPFFNARRDGIDDAALDGGWRKVCL